MSEILAPAGDEKSAYAAIDAGADAIYLGLTAFSARSSAENFSLAALEKLTAYAHVLGVKIYVAMNTLVKEDELESFVRTAVDVHNAGADAIIIQDLYLGAYLKKNFPEMCLHLSTQAGVCNAYGAKYAKKLGFSRVILARETPYNDVREIAGIIETEVFVQGALCTCFSGQCYLSSFAGGNSGNRGKCKQPCRKKYKLNRGGFGDYAYRISLSDLCMGKDVLKLIDCGVASFKIEGRMRRPEYVSAAVRYYKNIINGCEEKQDLSALKRTYNRGNYTKGLIFGQDKSLISSAVQGHMGEYVGVISVENGKYVCRGAEGCGEGDCFKILRGGSEVGGAVLGGNIKGGAILKSAERLKNGDKVFITTDRKLNESLLKNKRALPVDVTVRVCAGERPYASVNGRGFSAYFTAEQANGSPLTEDDLKTCFGKIGEYPLTVRSITAATCGNAFIPLSRLNAFRRQVYAQFCLNLSKPVNKITACALPQSTVKAEGKNGKICVIAGNLNGVKADIGVLKPQDYTKDLSPLVSGFRGEKFLYLPPFLSGEETESLKPLLIRFDGIYCGGNYSVQLAEELNLKLFAGVGFNLSNALSIAACPAHYKAISKELTIKEATPLADENTFYLTCGDVKVMDLIYCPFGKTCRDCDKRGFYTLTDEENRAFPLRRYSVLHGCRFELFNCSPLVSENRFTGVLADFTLSDDPAANSALTGDVSAFKRTFKNYTSGHTRNAVI